MLLSLRGVLDAETTVKLDALLQKSLGEPSPVILLRLAELDYVNSSGMGLLIKYSDLCQARGGSLALVEVSPKILALFRMLGLLSVLKTYPSPSQAVAALRGGASPAVSPPRPSPPPAAPVPAPVPRMEAPPPPPPPVRQDGLVRFPFATSCKTCQTRLVMPEAGTYRCPTCSTYYEASLEQPLQAFPSARRIPFEAVLDYDAACFEGVCAVADRMAGSAGLPEEARTALARALRETLDHLGRRADGKGRLLRLIVAWDPGECLIGLRTDVRLSGQEDPALEGLRACADRVEVIDVPDGCFLKVRKGTAASGGTSSD